MARPAKQGLDYFSLDTDFFQSIKIRKIKMSMGMESITVIIGFLMNIYRNKGYYMAWDDDMPVLIADEIGGTESNVIEVMKKAIDVGFFDKGLAEKGVITSKEIQSRYTKIISTSRRVGCEISPEHNLLIDVSSELLQSKPPVSSEETTETTEESTPNDTESTQSKVKKSKVNNIPPISPQGGSEVVDDSSRILEDEITVEADDEKRKKVAPKKEKPEPPAIEEFVAYGLANITGVTSYRSDLWESVLRRKYTAWLESGWKTGGKKPKPIQVWKTTLLNSMPYLERDVSIMISSQPTMSKLEHNLSVGARVWGIN